MRVITLDRIRFSNACHALATDVIGSLYVPDVIIPIATGGVYVYDEMKNNLPGNAHVVVISLKRKSTEKKDKSRLIAFTKHFPYWVTNWLRRIEAYQLNYHNRAVKKDDRDINVEEGGWPHVASKTANVLVLDDAVDSGRTLKKVVEAIKKQYGESANIRTAVVVVTTKHPSVSADYSIFQNVLCRFPWSYDFKG